MIHMKNKRKEGAQKVREKQKCDAQLAAGKLITFVVLGDKQVGKTALVSRFTGNFFSPNYAPTVEDCYFKNYHDKVQETTYNLRIIDTSGYYHFPAMQRLNIIHADIILLVYEVRNVRSMKRVNQLYSVVQDELKKGRSNTPIVCVGTKIDKTKDTDNYEDKIMQEFISQNSNVLFRHILTSARLDINVTDAFRLGLEMMGKNKTRHLPSTERRPTFQDVVRAKLHDLSVPHSPSTLRHQQQEEEEEETNVLRR